MNREIIAAAIAALALGSASSALAQSTQPRPPAGFGDDLLTPLTPPPSTGDDLLTPLVPDSGDDLLEPLVRDNGDDLLEPLVQDNGDDLLEPLVQPNNDDLLEPLVHTNDDDLLEPLVPSELTPAERAAVEQLVDLMTEGGATDITTALAEAQKRIAAQRRRRAAQEAEWERLLNEQQAHEEIDYHRDEENEEDEEQSDTLLVERKVVDPCGSFRVSWGGRKICEETTRTTWEMVPTHRSPPTPEEDEEEEAPAPPPPPPLGLPGSPNGEHSGSPLGGPGSPGEGPAGAGTGGAAPGSGASGESRGGSGGIVPTSPPGRPPVALDGLDFKIERVAAAGQGTDLFVTVRNIGARVRQLPARSLTFTATANTGREASSQPDLVEWGGASSVGSLTLDPGESVRVRAKFDLPVAGPFSVRSGQATRPLPSNLPPEPVW